MNKSNHDNNESSSRVNDNGEANDIDSTYRSYNYSHRNLGVSFNDIRGENNNRDLDGVKESNAKCGSLIHFDSSCRDKKTEGHTTITVVKGLSKNFRKKKQKSLDASSNQHPQNSIKR